jgi:hypothetical protein
MEKKRKANPTFIHGDANLPEGWEIIGINKAKLGEDTYFWASPSHKGDKFFGWIKERKRTK